MNKIIWAAATAMVSAGAATAGGIDRSGQPVGIIFKDGNYAEFSVARTNPNVSGEDLRQASGFDSGASYGSVADEFNSISFGIKYDITDKFSLSLLGGEDFGSDITYPGDPATSLLAGTSAEANTYALSLVGRYKFNENWSVHGGVRADRADGEISLNGLAYGGPTVINPATGAPISTGVSGYNVELDNDIAYGYLVGAAYERPEIALRVALTYFSPIKHEFKTTETLPVRAATPGGLVDISSSQRSERTEVNTPQAINLDFQTGIAENTLLFGGIRWAEWSEFKIEPEAFNDATGSGLVDLDDSTTYTIGIARRFTETFAASASFIYEPTTGDDLVSPLAPTNGNRAIAVGGSWRIEDIELSVGARYNWLGDAKPETGTPDVARARFDDNTAWSVGVRVGYYF